MKTYIHPKGYKAEQTKSHLFDGPRYNVRIYKGVIGYNLFQFPVAEQELLDFGFIEDEKEDWIDKVLEEFDRLSKLDEKNLTEFMGTWDEEKVKKWRSFRKSALQKAIEKHLPK